MAADAPDLWVCAIPASAQTNRVYADYLRQLAATPTSGLELRAIAVLGPRNRIGKLTGKLDLLA